MARRKNLEGPELDRARDEMAMELAQHFSARYAAMGPVEQSMIDAALSQSGEAKRVARSGAS